MGDARFRGEAGPLAPRGPDRPPRLGRARARSGPPPGGPAPRLPEPLRGVRPPRPRGDGRGNPRRRLLLVFAPRGRRRRRPPPRPARHGSDRGGDREGERRRGIPGGSEAARPPAGEALHLGGRRGSDARRSSPRRSREEAPRRPRRPQAPRLRHRDLPPGPPRCRRGAGRARPRGDREAGRRTPPPARGRGDSLRRGGLFPLRARRREARDRTGEVRRLPRPALRGAPLPAAGHRRDGPRPDPPETSRARDGREEALRDDDAPARPPRGPRRPDRLRGGPPGPRRLRPGARREGAGGAERRRSPLPRGRPRRGGRPGAALLRPRRTLRPVPRKRQAAQEPRRAPPGFRPGREGGSSPPPRPRRRRPGAPRGPLRLGGLGRSRRPPRRPRCRLRLRRRSAPRRGLGARPAVVPRGVRAPRPRGAGRRDPRRLLRSRRAPGGGRRRGPLRGPGRPGCPRAGAPPAAGRTPPSRRSSRLAAGSGPGPSPGTRPSTGWPTPGATPRGRREGRPRPRLADRHARRREGPPLARPALPEGAALHPVPLPGVGPARDRGPSRPDDVAPAVRLARARLPLAPPPLLPGRRELGPLKLRPRDLDVALRRQGGEAGAAGLPPLLLPHPGPLPARPVRRLPEGPRTRLPSRGPRRPRPSPRPRRRDGAARRRVPRELREREGADRPPLPPRVPRRPGAGRHLLLHAGVAPGEARRAPRRLGSRPLQAPRRRPGSLFPPRPAPRDRGLRPGGAPPACPRRPERPLRRLSLRRGSSGSSTARPRRS